MEENMENKINNDEIELANKLDKVVIKFYDMSARQALNEIGDIVGWDIIVEYANIQNNRGKSKFVSGTGPYHTNFGDDDIRDQGMYEND
jgi:hypothetical protein